MEVDGFTRKSEFIVTEWPKAQTLDSFWTLVFDHSVHTVINLTNFSNNKVGGFISSCSLCNMFSFILHSFTTKGKRTMDPSQWKSWTFSNILDWHRIWPKLPKGLVNSRKRFRILYHINPLKGIFQSYRPLLWYLWFMNNYITKLVVKNITFLSLCNIFKFQDNGRYAKAEAVCYRAFFGAIWPKMEKGQNGTATNSQTLPSWLQSKALENSYDWWRKKLWYIYG